MDLQEALCNEIKINRVYETKIKRLERQALRYEEDIRWLYKVIENLENNAKHNKDELCDLKSQLTNLSLRLQHANKICDEKEQFIAFRESQLLEFEDTIHSLKERIHFLSREKRKLKMSALHTDPPDVIMTDKDELGELGTID
jgi:chromosome segregation ATPase